MDGETAGDAPTDPPTDAADADTTSVKVELTDIEPTVAAAAAADSTAAEAATALAVDAEDVGQEESEEIKVLAESIRASGENRLPSLGSHPETPPAYCEAAIGALLSILQR